MNQITHKDLIDLSRVSIKDYKYYLDFFSEGSIELRKCLEELWKRKLYTTACCKGHNIEEKEYIIDGKAVYFINLYAYISMKPNCNILEYLSEELLMDPYIQISRDKENRDSIYIYGRDRLKKLKRLARDIKSGIKYNDKLMSAILNKTISGDIKKLAYREYFYDNNFYLEEIKRIEEIERTLFMNHYTNNLNNDEIYKICEEQNNILKKVRERNIKNK